MSTKPFAALLILLIVALLPMVCFSQGLEVTRQQADEVAFYYLRVAPPPEVPGGPNATFRQAGDLRIAQGNRLVGYVYHINPIGFFVISADRRIEPLIAYSGVSDFDAWSDSPANCLLDVMLQDLSLRMDAAAVNQVPSQAENLASWDWIAREVAHHGSPYALASMAMNPSNYSGAGHIMKQPLDWHQGYPFNQETPHNFSDAKGSYQVGCVALAIAQVLAHHQYPSQTSFPPGHTFEINGHAQTLPRSMPYRFSYPPSNAQRPSNDVCARLCNAAALAVHMDYGLNDSGAYLSEAGRAFRNHFDFKTAIVRSLLEQCPGETAKVVNHIEFGNLLNADVQDAGRPALLSMSGTHGTHAVVVDGHQTETRGGVKDVDRYGLRMGKVNETASLWYMLPIEYSVDFNNVCAGAFKIQSK